MKTSSTYKACRAAGLAAFFVATVAVPAEAQERFYLSTDKVFAPGQPAQVKLESKGVSSLQFRLYRIDAPKAYFDAQRDLHRPEEQVAPPRKTTATILGRALSRGLNQELRTLRSQLHPEGREALKRTFPSLHNSALDGAGAVSVQTVVPLLKAHTLIDVWDHALPSSGSWNYSTVPIPVSEPGVYLVEATAGAQTAHAVLLVSHVAIVSKQSSNTLLVWAIDPATGAPRPDAKVSVQVRGQDRGSKETDAQGLARFDLGLTSSAVIYAETKDSFTLLDPRFFPANLPSPRVYVYTERPVYRPSQTVYIKGFARNIQDEAYVLPQASEAELQIVDPKGTVLQTVKTEVTAQGSFHTVFELPSEPTHGTWTVFAKVNEHRHAGEFKIMAFVKPEVKLRVRLDKTAVRSGERLSGDVVGAYFYGAPYPGAEVKITVSRTRFYIPWYVDADYRWYYSESEYQNTRRETVYETTCTLNDAGECSFETTTEPNSEDFTYVVEAVAQDPKGKTIIGAQRASVTRGAYYLSIEQATVVARPGASQTIVIKALGYDQAPVSTEVEVLVTGQHIATDGVKETVEILRTKVTTDAAGHAQVNLQPDKAGYYEIVASSTDDMGHRVDKQGFLFVAEAGSAVPLAPTDIELVTDKKTYFAGDTATILVLAPSPSAHVLFAVEGGDLYQAKVVQTQGHATVVEVKITDKQTPNFFITATCIAGGQMYSKQRSVIVPPREKLLRVEVAPEKAKVEPGDEVGFSVIVTDHAGAPVPNAEVAVGVVDEAIYSVSPEITVPIESFFYHRKRNDVRTHDSLSFRFFGRSKTAGAKHASRSDDSPFSFGSLKPQEDDRKVFKDTAGWFPTLTTDADGTAKGRVTLPDNLAAWRLTARVMSPDTAVGSGTAKVIATKPLIVQVAFPPRVYEGDSGQGTLTVHNLTGQDDSFDISLDLSPAEGSDAQVEVQAPDLGNVTIRQGDNRRFPFTYSAAGSGAVQITARAKGASAQDGLQKTAEVVPWSRTAIVSASGRTSAQALTSNHSMTVPDGVKPKQATMTVELMGSSMGAVRSSLPYLMGFPYGCIEQTMSRFVPVLSAKKAMQTLSMTTTGLEDELSRSVQGGLTRIAALQHDDGGWGWWQHDSSDPWMSAWVLEGLAEAQSLGVTVDPEVLKKGLSFLEKALSRSQNSAALKSRALLALARHNKNKPAMLARAVESSEAPEVLSALLLAAQAGGETELVAMAQAKLTAAAQPGEFGTSWCAGPATEAMRDTVECTAQVTLALASTGADPAVLTEAERFLMHNFDGTSFGSTRQTALAVRALSQLSRSPAREEASFGIFVHNQKVAEVTVAADQSEPLRLTPKLKISQPELEVSVRQKGGGSFFHTIVLSGPERRESFAAQGPVQVTRAYYALDGSAGNYRKGAPRAAFTSGDTVLVSLTVRASSDIEHFMLEDPRVAGLEPVTQDSGVQVRGVRLKPTGVHREHRADRTVFFQRRLKRGVRTFHYLARASYTGRFHVLPSHAESMYLPARAFGDSTSKELEVRAR